MEIAALYELFRNSTGISTDTRSIRHGNIFFALKGDHFNGNLFAEQALQTGASRIIIDEQHFSANEKLILVDDVLNTLQQLANFHRHQLQTKILAIGGSNGKTTTKELISRVLETSFKTFSTQGNLNNHIGVPLSLLSINDETEFAVIEMGANHLDETKLLCEIAEPDFGLITNNGKDHLEGYGSIENVRSGNGELYDFLRKKNRHAFVCSDHDDLMQMSEGLLRTTYGMRSFACRGRITSLFPYLEIEADDGSENFDLKLKTQVIGKYNFENVMAAVVVGQAFGISSDKIMSAIESYIPLNNRSQILHRGTNTFILDAYNANPSSMNAALENFFLIPAENKIVILGDMAELGTSSEKEHRDIISKVKKEKLTLVILVGEEFKKALEKPPTSFLHFKNVEQLKEWFQSKSFDNYFFLLKGSRIIGLENLLA